MKEIVELANKYFEDMINYRRRFHQNPELSGKEFETSAFIISELKKIGIEVKAPIAKTGVQGMIYGNNPQGKIIMLRADMDALPMEELNCCDYSSKNKGVCHSCGHDVHTAILLGAAKILWDIKDSLNGSVKLCFQPAEEGIGGADLMVEEGILEDPKVDYAIGLHVDPTHRVGEVSLEDGPISSYPDFFEIKVSGRGGHGSFPSKSNDPILPAVEIYNMLLTIHKKISPLEPNVLQICKFQAGNSNSVIPDEACLEGTVRTLKEENRELIKCSMEKIVNSIGDIYNVKTDFYYRGHCSPVINDPEYAEKARECIKDIFDNFVVNENQKIGGEDFCYYCKHVPATFMLVGSADENPSTQFALHNPHFNVNEKVMIKGAAALSSIAVNYLNKRPS